MIIATIRADARCLRIVWPDGEAADFPFIWLRDNCPSAFHPQTLERQLDLTAIPPDIVPEAVVADADAVSITWRSDGGAAAHASRFDACWLRAHRPGSGLADAAAIPATTWRGNVGAYAIPRVRAEDILSSDAALRTWMVAVKTYGLSIVEGLGDPALQTSLGPNAAAEAGMAVARRIGFLRETNFGTVFEVVSKPDPNNLAYTAQALPLHTDLPNQEFPPGYQFLHCLANDAQGGGSVFCDGFAVAEDLHTEDPATFALLRDTRIPFRFHDIDYDIRRHEPVIRCDPDGTLAEIRFNAHIATTFDMPAADMERYYMAYRAFMLASRSARYAVALRLEAGEMAVFDNRRILHGREAFDPGSGRRHLRGCYVDRGEFDSRLRVLCR